MSNQEDGDCFFSLDRKKRVRGCFREKGRLALLLFHQRPLRVFSVLAPSHPTFLAKTASLGLFQRAANERNDTLGSAEQNGFLRQKDGDPIWRRKIGNDNLCH